MRTIYKNIKTRRKQLGMSQTELAERVGYTDKAMISMIEHGKIDLPYSKILAISQALHIGAADLFGDDGIVGD